jgi:hypothetical protein
MIFDIEKLICTDFFDDTNREKDFYCSKVVLSPKTNSYDRHILKQLITQGTELAKKVNPGAANDASLKRDYNRILINSIAGLTAEYLWKAFLNLTNIDTIVIETEMEDVSKQIDLKTIKNNLSIEVRSSFPRNGLSFAICHPKYQFDIIGPYSNGYKPDEIQKNFYARTLFPFDFNEFNNAIKEDGFTVYLTGGATWEMFENNKITKKKTFIPEDEITIDRLSTKSEYLVIPFCDALDSIELFNKIKSQ